MGHWEKVNTVGNLLKYIEQAGFKDDAPLVFAPAINSFLEEAQIDRTPFVYEEEGAFAIGLGLVGKDGRNIYIEDDNETKEQEI